MNTGMKVAFVIMWILIGVFVGLIGGCVIEDTRLALNVKRGYKIFFQTNFNYLSNGTVETNYSLIQIEPGR